jgi:hypothetical protein
MLRVGLIGTDSTHAVEFARLFNAPSAPADWHGVRVVGSCAGAPTDFPLSIERRDRLAAQLSEELGLPRFASAASLAQEVDALLLLSCDGRNHLAEARPLLALRKPLFIDKPFTASLADAAALLREACLAGCPVFSVSALRYRAGLTAGSIPENSRPSRVDVLVPDTSFPGHPDFSWLGIHGVESAFAVLGGGCATVERRQAHGQDELHLTWPDGAQAILRRSAESAAREFPATVSYATGARRSTFRGHRYEPLLGAIAKFFATGHSPVSPRELAEVIAVIEAADLSRDRYGQCLHLPTLLRQSAVDL